MTNESPKPQGKEPHREPEIIPPSQAEHGTPRMRVVLDTERMYFVRPGPFGTILTVLIAGLLLTVMLIMLLGAFLVFLPAAVLFITVAIIAGLLRIYFQR